MLNYSDFLNSHQSGFHLAHLLIATQTDSQHPIEIKYGLVVALLVFGGIINSSDYDVPSVIRLVAQQNPGGSAEPFFNHNNVSNRDIALLYVAYAEERLIAWNEYNIAHSMNRGAAAFGSCIRIQ
ncbi:hypothetical protein EVAR_102621_1 [Eumeta japonica]|uniref:Uncharacterized protein n=1 Tax=Eumeta variegata TaxID=151549 RepID=A0A4C1TUR4_EUMVA|nr:hypothetical protein EVAR_102621_1 [Eumeta japonica]